VDRGADFLSWGLIRNQRLSKDYERLVQTSETFIEVAMIRLILRRDWRGECEPYQTGSKKLDFSH